MRDGRQADYGGDSVWRQLGAAFRGWVVEGKRNAVSECNDSITMSGFFNN